MMFGLERWLRGCIALAVLLGAAVPACAARAAAWSVVNPAPAVFADGELDAVSCVSGEFCLAVGSHASGSLPLAEQRTGGSWSLVPGPLPRRMREGKLVG